MTDDSEHSFRHDAMASTFTLKFNGVKNTLADSIARECIDKLDHLESLLSRYVEGSDVHQINHMQSGDTLLLSRECYECIRLALEASQITEGLFDITVGKRAEQRKRGENEDNKDSGRLIISPDIPEIACETAGREIDLGGIGKGYALDKLADILRSWDIKQAFLSAGASTLLALNFDKDKGYPVQLMGQNARSEISLSNSSLSSSGTAFQGSHIVAPIGRDKHYAALNIWVHTRTAALSDALSTACYLMSSEELKAFAAQTDEIISLHIENNAGIEKIKGSIHA